MTPHGELQGWKPWTFFPVLSNAVHRRRERGFASETEAIAASLRLLQVQGESDGELRVAIGKGMPMLTPQDSPTSRRFVSILERIRCAASA